jgi:hypothetical protein
MEGKKFDDAANDAKRYSHSSLGNGHQIKQRQRSWTHRIPFSRQRVMDISCTTRPLVVGSDTRPRPRDLSF